MANLLGFIQMFVQWFMFHIMYTKGVLRVFFILFYLCSFVLYFKMYPESLKYEDHPSALTENWSFSLKIKRAVRVYSIVMTLLVLLLAFIKGFPSPLGNAIAWILGIFSMILSIFQFIPQIHQTFQHKVKEYGDIAKYVLL